MIKNLTIEVNNVEVDEFYTFMVNDEKAMQVANGYINCIAKKLARGKFDKDKALKAMYNVAVEGIKRYHEVFGDPSSRWYYLADVPTRKAIAEKLLYRFTEEIQDIVSGY